MVYLIFFLIVYSAYVIPATILATRDYRSYPPEFRSTSIGWKDYIRVGLMVVGAPVLAWYECFVKQGGLW